MRLRLPSFCPKSGKDRFISCCFLESVKAKSSLRGNYYEEIQTLHNANLLLHANIIVQFM